MVSNRTKLIFKNSSTTYYFSSIFFPPQIKEKVFKLYAFVRIADNLVDSLPQQPKEFYKLKKNLDKYKILKTFPKKWVDSFLNSMEMDLKINKYTSQKKLDLYIYGSANVIGLMMAKILDLPKESYPYAQKLGYAMQYINFIRDIDEDNKMGRKYLIKQDSSSIKIYIKRYFQILKQAETGYRYIPKKYLVPIKTATDMYTWTAWQIYKNPKIVFTKKVKPSRIRVITRALYNYVTI